MRSTENEQNARTFPAEAHATLGAHGQQERTLRGWVAWRVIASTPQRKRCSRMGAGV